MGQTAQDQTANLFRADDFTIRRLRKAWARPNPGFDLQSLTDAQFANLLEAVFGSMPMMDRTTILLSEACVRLRRRTG